MGVAYDSELHRVKELMIQTAQDNPRVLSDPGPVCQLKKFGAYSIEMELRFWIRDPERGVANVSSEIRMAIWDAFKTHGIEIPFPQRVVHNVKESPP